nr:hypothetical protein [Tanacetum cinerariifolium]
TNGACSLPGKVEKGRANAMEVVEWAGMEERILKDGGEDYVDLVDSDIFSLYELFGMLKELDVDIINLLNYVPGCKEIEVYIEIGMSLVELDLLESLVVSQSHSKRLGNDVVIKEIVKDNVVSSSAKDSRLLMIEWPDMDEHVDTLNHASTSNVCPVVKPTIDEHVEYLYCDNEDEGSDFKRDANELRHSELEADMQHFHFKVDANLDQSRTFADKHWQEFGLDVLDFNELSSGGKQSSQAIKRILWEIKRECVGKANIKDGYFFVPQKFANRKLITDKLRILVAESRRVI